jgi:hypothetical protein
LDAGVVARLLDLRLRLEVYDPSDTPDEELIIREPLRSGRVADDLAILDLPQIWVAIPAGGVFAVEEGGGVSWLGGLVEREWCA